MVGRHREDGRKEGVEGVNSRLNPGGVFPVTFVRIVLSGSGGAPTYR
jgi:hypothetical protein